MSYTCNLFVNKQECVIVLQLDDVDKSFKKCLNSIIFLLLNMEYQPTRPNKKATWCSTSTRLLIHFRWEHVKWKDVTMEVDVRDLSNTKGPSMFLPNNFNRQICWSDLMILFMVRNFYWSNLLIFFIGKFFFCTFFMVEFLLLIQSTGKFD